MSGIFITGTNTGVGKTVICGHLASYLRETGSDVVTQKWVQTGCSKQAEDLLVHDQLTGNTGSSPARDERDVRAPYIFTLPASPHLAAAEAGTRINPDTIRDAYMTLEKQHELVLVEGAGGLIVPLTENVVMGDMAAQLGLPALIVVDNTLGCINHSLLTIEALRQRDMPIIGLIFNTTTRTGNPTVQEDNPRIISQIAGVPVLGKLPFLDDVAGAHDRFEQIGNNFQQEYQKVADNE